MSVEELYDLCGNWLPNTTVSVFSRSTRAVTTFTYYREVIKSHGDKLVDNFCWFPREGIFAINVR